MSINRITRNIISLLILSLAHFCIQAQEIEKEVDVFKANNFYEMAKNAYDDENYDASLGFFNEAFKENPGSADYLFGRALCHYELGNLDSAAFDIEKAIEYEPDQPDYHHYAGNIYFKYGDLNLAIANYLKAAENQGNNDVYINEVSNYFNLGTCFLLIDIYPQATVYFSKVIALDEDYAIAYYNRGIAYERIKLKSLACQDFKYAAEKGITKAQKKIKSNCE